jgi:glycosyltransferase involved in cell wall biosynthesis
MSPAIMLFTGTRYDLEPELLARTPWVIHQTRWGVVRTLLSAHHPVIEVMEPAAVDGWPFLFAQIAAIRIRSLVSRRPATITSYCIANGDPTPETKARWHLPGAVARRVTNASMRLLVHQVDRLAFGTVGALRMYEGHVGADGLRGRAELFEALPAPCACLTGATDERRCDQVLFVGAFVERKGVRETMRAWDVFRAQRPDATLRVLGQGRLAGEILAWSVDRPEASVEVDPPRAEIHRALRQSGVLVLLSQPHPHWREQIGLPILEGLSHGCEIVTTSETGLADWLTRHDHEVVPPTATPSAVAASVAAALDRAHRRSGSLHDLPLTDQRIAAEAWMMTGQAP